MLKVILALSALTWIGCGGGGGSSNSASQNPPPEQGQGPNRVCYLGANQDYKTCIPTKSIDAEALGYSDPYTDPNFMGTGDKAQYRMPKRAVLLKEVLPSLKISPDFILNEVMSLAKDSFGIYSPQVVEVLQKIRNSSSQLRINSAFRSPEYNASIQGSAKWSRHLYGDAFDVASSRLSLDQIVTLCKQLGATYTDKYERHVHCDWRDQNLPVSFFDVSQIQKREFDTEAYVEELKSRAQLRVQGTSRAQNVVQLTSSIDIQEDPDNLYKKWRITTPSGQILESELQAYSLLLEPGAYYIQHWMGEHIYLEKTLTISK